MEKGISEIVGCADLDEGRSTELYRALRSLLCSTCGAEIKEGMLFTRRKVKGIGVRIMPQCAKCEPFTPQPGKEKESTLLRSLLAEPAKDLRRRASLPSEDSAKSRIIEEKVRQRLEPALDRARRKGK